MSNVYRDKQTALDAGLPKGLAVLLDDDRILEIEDDRTDRNGYWIYIADGFWSPDMNCRTIHEDTVRACLDKVRAIEPVEEEEAEEPVERPVTHAQRLLEDLQAAKRREPAPEAVIPASRFAVRLVRAGDRYGRDDCLTHGEADALVEFYDLDHPHVARETFSGQFVSRYYVSTLLEHAQQCPGAGLCLDGGVPAWQIDGREFAFVAGWIHGQIRAAQ